VIDGPLGQCALNQPSGLATDGRRLYFADSEASAIRWADLGPKGRVETIVAPGCFDFGDVDGSGDSVRLQHPLGLVFQPDTSSGENGRLIVADTYNNKIKVVEPRDGGRPRFWGRARTVGATGRVTRPGSTSPAG